MAQERSQKGSRFFRYMGPVIEALQDLGGSGRPAEAVGWITERLNISEEEQSSLLASGQPRYVNDIHWARYYLAQSGYIDSSKRGVWSLTKKGLSASLSSQEALSIRQEVQTAYREREAAKSEEHERDDTDKDEAVSEELPTPEPIDYRSRLMEILKNLPSEGFERLSQRLLRESGFQQVRIPMKSTTSSGHVVHPAERSDASVHIIHSSGRHGQGGVGFAPGSPLEIEPVGVVDEAIQNGVSDGWVGEAGMPLCDRHLSNDQGGGSAIAIIHDFEQVLGLAAGEGIAQPVIEDQELHSGERVEEFGIGAVSVG
jgi:hypothetical protein